MWYDYFENSSLLTYIYTQVPSLENFRLAEVQWQPGSSIMQIRGDLSQFPDNSIDWQPPYNTLQMILEFKVVQMIEFAITNPSYDIYTAILVEKMDSQYFSFQLTSPSCTLHFHFQYAEIVGLSKYIRCPETSC